MCFEECFVLSFDVCYSFHSVVLEGTRNELQTRVFELDQSNSALEVDKQRLTCELTESQKTCEILKTQMLTASVSLENAEKTGKDAVKLKDTLEGVSAERDKFREQRDVARRKLAERNEDKVALERLLIAEKVESARLREALNIANMERMRIEQEVCVYSVLCYCELTISPCSWSLSLLITSEGSSDQWVGETPTSPSTPDRTLLEFTFILLLQHPPYLPRLLFCVSMYILYLHFCDACNAMINMQSLSLATPYEL